MEASELLQIRFSSRSTRNKGKSRDIHKLSIYATSQAPRSSYRFFLACCNWQWLKSEDRALLLLLQTYWAMIGVAYFFYFVILDGFVRSTMIILQWWKSGGTNLHYHDFSKKIEQKINAANASIRFYHAVLLLWHISIQPNSVYLNVA